jgi:lipopolysaccharide transport system ATP-binding protein
MSIVISVENLSKTYLLGQIGTGTFSRDLEVWWAKVRGKPNPLLRIGQTDHGNRDGEELWALRDINFIVQSGEVLGVIGRNGAGKSTLLKIMSRVTAPTFGKIKVKGRIASLLEVGTGFHPELTGRENIFLNGAILGMSRWEIERKFEEIVDFAEVEKFIDTPVKRYSSGMYVRLAFAVAAHLEPEILLVDEVLAVGDAEFQKKCLGKMGDVAKEGRTVLFVSHNMGAITRLCPRSILLSQGVAEFDGESEIAVKKYLNTSSSNSSRRILFDDKAGLPIWFQEVAITSPQKTETEPLDIADPLFVEIRFQVRQNIKGSNLAFALKRDGIIIFRSWDIDIDYDNFKLRHSGNYLAQLALPYNLLVPGMYSIDVAAGQPGAGAFVQHNDCLVFELENGFHDASHSGYSRGGLLILPIKWKTKTIEL